MPRERERGRGRGEGCREKMKTGVAAAALMVVLRTAVDPNWVESKHKRHSATVFSLHSIVFRI